MSEEDNKTGVSTPGSPTVVIESVTSVHKASYKPNEIQDETMVDLHKKQAPIISVTENWKDTPEISVKGSEIEISSDKRKVAQNLSQVMNMKRDSHVLGTTIPMTTIVTKAESGEMKPRAWKGKTSVPLSPDIGTEREDMETKEIDKDSITSEITEMQSPDSSQEMPKWLDDMEAGGLPRSESRASRVTRAVRQLFCCGVQLEAASEDNMSSPRRGYYNSGI